MRTERRNDTLPSFQRDLDADGVPTEERWYDSRGELVEFRTWGYCE